MKIIVCENYDEMSKKAAEIVAKQVNDNPNSVLGLATGSTPIGMYNELAEMNKKGDIDFKTIRSFNLDEYYPLSADNDQSYHYFMNENLFSKINIDINNTHILDGLCKDTDAECDAFEKLIEENGGIDLQILGIGQNGHIGFNEPGENLNARTHLTDLTQNTIEANSRFFENISDVPTQALTMGMGTILKARKIVLLAGGKNKHRAVAELLNGSISTEMPASMLKVHSDVTLICDKEAFASDKLGVDIGGTEVKFGVVNGKNELVFKAQTETDITSKEALIDGIVNKCKEIMKEYCVASVGIGTPGTIKDGLVNAVNLPFKNVDLKKEFAERLGVPVRVVNDANCAAYGESVCGSGSNAKNMVMISLGTGVGGGIVIDNKIYEGKGSAGEIGHFVISHDGAECPCGLKGCFEQYASATALLDGAKTAAKENEGSELAKLFAENGGKMDGKLFFNTVKGGCETAKAVLDTYAGYLAAGIDGIANIFDPDMVVLSGGITNAGEVLLDAVKAKLNTEVDVVISELKGDAGTVGAALLG